MVPAPVARHRISPALWSGCAATALALPPRVVTALADFRTADESVWMVRSLRFGDAVSLGELADASAARGEQVTMPGVTTMWIGTLARHVWSWGRHHHGWWADDSTSFAHSATGLDVAQLVMAAVTALLVGYLAFVVARWAGPIAGGVVGVLLATEPFMVAHGAVLHTDELVALFSVAALVTLCLALGLPQAGPGTGRWWLGAVAGVLFGAACLTKLSALASGPGLLALVAWGAVAAVRRSEPEASRRRALRGPVAVGLAMLAATVVVVLATYPALRVDPAHEIENMRESAELAGTGHTQFFLGEVRGTPGPAFYAVTLPLRVTPWMLFGVAFALVVVCGQRSTRGFGAVLAIVALPPLVTLSLAAKQFDRYGLPLLVVAAVLVGVAVESTARSLLRTSRFPQLPRLAWGAGAVLVAGVTVHTLTVAPWGLAYFNPALGGGERAEETVLVGWGEGLEQAGALIAEREGDGCDEVTVMSYNIPSAFPCGKLIKSPSQATYVVLYVSIRQRLPDSTQRAWVGDRPRVGRVRVRGITYAEVFGPLPAQWPCEERRGHLGQCQAIWSGAVSVAGVVP